MQLEQAKQGIVAKAQEEIAKVVTVEKVFGFLRDQKTRPFVLMVATDSTIQPTPDVASDHVKTFVKGIFAVEGGRMISLIDLEHVLPAESEVEAA